MTIQLFEGDSASVLKTLAPESIDLTVTSPPYDNLRTYKGYSFDFEAIAKELFRVTKKGGVVVWVVGDATVDGSETGTSFRQALFFKEIGFNLHDTMLYQKQNPGGAIGSNGRYLQVFEYMFVLSKGKPKTFNPIEDRKNVRGGRTEIGGGHRNQNGSVAPCNTVSYKEFGRRFNIWSYPRGDGGLHPAVFPDNLAQDHILSWSNPGDTVLDPFLGSGTTGKMAVLNDRNFIGIEISAEYLQIAKDRIEAARLSLLPDSF
jgi:DNA modification methylase